MPINQFQCDAFKDPTRFKYILAGRRGGKTFLITQDIAETLRYAPPKAKIFYIGPTNSQAKELIWEPLIDLFSAHNWKFEPKIASQYIELAGKRRVYVIGAEKISRIRGHALHKVYMDELAFFSKNIDEIWRAVRPTLSDFQGPAILATTPNGKGTPAYDLWMEAQAKHNWATHSWRTVDNPYISKDEIEEAKKELDAKSFMQEYLAQWQSFVGLAYYCFDENKHIKKQPEVDYSKPLVLALDFNVNPTSLLLSQTSYGKKRYLKEYSFKNSSTEATIKAFAEDFKGKENYLRLIIRGDASGNNRSSNTGRSDYFYLKEQLDHYGFQYTMEVPRSNPAIVDRVKYMNSWLQPFEGEHKIEIDPSCKDLIRDLAAQELNGRLLSDKNNLGHKADAMGYDIYREYVNVNRPKSRAVLQ